VVSYNCKKPLYKAALEAFCRPFYGGAAPVFGDQQLSSDDMFFFFLFFFSLFSLKTHWNCKNLNKSSHLLIESELVLIFFKLQYIWF